jgi:hypothetical protein
MRGGKKKKNGKKKKKKKFTESPFFFWFARVGCVPAAIRLHGFSFFLIEKKHTRNWFCKETGPMDGFDCCRLLIVCPQPLSHLS